MNQNISRAFNTRASVAWILTVLLLVFVSKVATPQGTADAATLMGKLDKIRQPTGSFLVNVKAVEKNRKGAVKNIAFRLYAKAGVDTPEGFRSLVVMTAPAGDKGKLLLMRDEKTWFLDPPSRKPSVLPAKQLWQHSFVVDTMTGTLAAKYDPAITTRESIQTIDGKEVDCLVLDLSPKRKSLSASGTRRYWLGNDGRPWQLWYVSPSGAIVRKCRFGSYETVLEKLRPTKVEVEGLEGHATFHFAGFQAVALPDNLFDPDQLASLKLSDE